MAHGAEVRVSYDTRRTRLRAKGRLFHRTGIASTAYIATLSLYTFIKQESQLRHGGWLLEQKHG